MANAVVLAGWEGEGVKVGQVVDTMSRLRRQTARTATRTTVLTLVIVALDDADEARATATVHVLSDQHPARIIVVRPEPVGDNRIDARVSVWGIPDGGGAERGRADRGATAGDATAGGGITDPSRVSLDEICLTVHGGAASHLDSVIEPLTLPDVPVVVWYPGRLPPPSAPLLSAASTVIVDSKEAGDRGALSDIAALAEVHRAVVDLSWVRLTPWREMLAGLFDGETFRPLAHRVRSGTVQGKAGPRHLLGGWLASRLRLPPDTLTLVDSVHAGIRLEATNAETRAVATVTRAVGERAVRAEIAIEAGPSRSTVVPLPDDSLSWSLSRALSRAARDWVWEEALRAALAL